MKFDIAEIKAAADGRWPDIFSERGGADRDNHSAAAKIRQRLSGFATMRASRQGATTP